MTKRARLLSLALATVASSVGIAATAESDASAQVRIRVGGRAHVRVGGRVRVRAPHVRWRVRRHRPPPVRVHVGGAIWVGGGWYGPRFAAPPPPRYYDDCDCGPGYGYHPVEPSAGVAVVAPAPRPPLPRWGVGVAAGGVDVQGEPAGDDLALLGRLRLTPGLLLEGEIGKSELEDGARVDRRLGASLIWELGAYNRLAPYVVGGLGVTQVEVDRGDYETNQEFAEIGVGLRLALTHRVHLAADIRAGSRSASGEAEPLDAEARMVTPDEDESEEYTRARLSGILYF